MEKKADLKELVDLNTLNNISTFELSYDKEIDTLILKSRDKEPAVSVDWNDELWIRINPNTGKIVGIEIEDYRRYFSRRYGKYLGNRDPNNPYLKNVIISLLESKLIMPMIISQNTQ